MGQRFYGDEARTLAIICSKGRRDQRFFTSDESLQKAHLGWRHPLRREDPFGATGELDRHRSRLAVRARHGGPFDQPRSFNSLSHLSRRRRERSPRIPRSTRSTRFHLSQTEQKRVDAAEPFLSYSELHLDGANVGPCEWRGRARGRGDMRCSAEGGAYDADAVAEMEVRVGGEVG